MKLWVVSMECAGIAEAGGVKNVTFSLCKEFSELGHKVTLFIPVFKCNTWNLIENLEPAGEQEILICGKKTTVSYSKGICTDGNFPVVFVNNKCYSEKEAVYCYTEHEQQLNPEVHKGEGYKDALYMDILFQKAVAAYSNLIPKSEVAEIVHCQDASTACLPAFLNQNKHFNKTKSVVTIHNAGPFYHHSFTSMGEAAWYTNLPTELLENSLNVDAVEPFLIASNSGAYLSTVSEHYAEELIDPENSAYTDGLAPIFAERGIVVKGITNGFDFDRYNPENKQDSQLPFEYNPEKGELTGKLKCRKFFVQNIVNTDNFNTNGIKKYGKLDCSPEYTKEIFIAYHGRITGQKGITVLTHSIPGIIENFPNVRFVIAGQGEPRLEEEIIDLTKMYDGKITFMNGYNKTVARLSSAVCDFIVLPSDFEPCGLEDFIAQVFGTLPIAHRTGGLNKIIDGKTGFLYGPNTAAVLIAKISEVLMIKQLKPAQINKMIKTAASTVRKEYYWKTVIQKKYLPYFKEILKNL